MNQSTRHEMTFILGANLNKCLRLHLGHLKVDKTKVDPLVLLAVVMINDVSEDIPILLLSAEQATMAPLPALNTATADIATSRSHISRSMK